MSEIGIVLTTFENAEQSRKAISFLIEKKLVACAQEIPIKSHYTWKNKLCHDDEILVLMKTRKSLYKKLEKELKSVHPYETPEIVFIDIKDGLEAYFKWVFTETDNSI